MKNKLYFGDNLEVLREFESDSVDLIATDPPFNSGRDYNIFLADSKAQKKAFADIWTWDAAAKNLRADIEKRALGGGAYEALNNALKGYDLILNNAVSGNKAAMRAYLAFMGPRLAEMWRVLKQTGSIYLHCDPSASHYLKGIMDAVWDQSNRSKNQFFRNEIIWHYTGGGRAKRYYSRKHDVLLYYTKSDNFDHCFNIDEIRVPYKETSGFAKGGIVSKSGKRYKPHPKGTPVDDVWDIPIINPLSKERLGYPTQKPLDLYERIIKASSKEGDAVLDPFAGCGTTIDAAHGLDRRWIGIDLTILALEPMQKRLSERHEIKPHIDYQIFGYPTNLQEAQKLAEHPRRKHDFANWAVTRLGLRPTPDVGDGGFDGAASMQVWTLNEKESARIIAEVKSGKPTMTQVRAFCHTIRKNKAKMGVFITLGRVTKGMRQEAADMGTFEHNKQTYPRFQFWEIDEAYFDDPASIKKQIRIPEQWIIEPGRKAERHVKDTQGALNMKGSF